MEDEEVFPKRLKSIKNVVKNIKKYDQETRDMLDNFAIAVKGGIHYTEKDFAVLGTETATHPKNSEALANLQIFFRQLNTQRRFEELGQDLLGTMLHLKEVLQKDIPKAETAISKHKVSKSKLKTALTRLAKEFKKIQKQSEDPDAKKKSSDEWKKELAVTSFKDMPQLIELEKKLMTNKSKEIFRAWTIRGAKTEEKWQNADKLIRRMNCNRELLLLHQLRTCIFLHQRIANKSILFAQRMEQLMPTKEALDVFFASTMRRACPVQPVIVSTISFGASLDTCPKSEWKDTKIMVPIVVAKCMEYLYKYGLDAEGLFRVPGSFGKIAELKKAFHDNAEDVDLCELLEEGKDARPNTAATLLKQFFRDLQPEGLFPTSCTTEILKMVETVKTESSQVKAIASITADRELMPQVNYNCAYVLMQLCKAIIANKEVNMMAAHPLSVCLAPTLLVTSPRVAKSQRASKRQTFMEISKIAEQSKDLNRVMATILRNVDAIFHKKHLTTAEEP